MHKPSWSALMPMLRWKGWRLRSRNCRSRPEETMEMRKLETLCAKAMGAVIELNAVEGEPVFNDAITGQLLRPELVKAARREELEYFAAKRVWTKVPRQMAMQD